MMLGMSKYLVALLRAKVSMHETLFVQPGALLQRESCRGQIFAGEIEERRMNI
jgi:hypothetical protein